MEKREGPSTKKAKPLFNRKQWKAPQISITTPKDEQGKTTPSTYEYTGTDSASGPS